MDNVVLPINLYTPQSITYPNVRDVLKSLSTSHDQVTLLKSQVTAMALVTWWAKFQVFESKSFSF